MFVAKLTERINAKGTSQVSLAEALGYSNANMISLFKKGTTRIPLDKVVPFAQALDVDPAELIHEWFDTYMPGILSAIEPYIGMALTANEEAWVRRLRKLWGRVPPFRSEWEVALMQMFNGQSRTQ
jgi:transcriptional regulator with XRE-family HTH domain